MPASKFKREKINGGVEGLKKRVKTPGTVDVGIIDAGEHDSGDITVAGIGFVHEFGAVINHPGGTSYKFGAGGKAMFVKAGTPGIVGVTKPHEIVIPERSFMRSTLAEQRKKIIAMQKKLLKKIISGDITTEKALGVIGQFVSDEIRQKINNGPFKELKASTIRRKKGGNKPLVETTQLKNSITYEVNR